MSVTIKKMLRWKHLKSTGPIMKPCGTPYTIFDKVKHAGGIICFESLVFVWQTVIYKFQ